MASWEQARNELNQEQAQAKAYRERFEELAEDAAYRLVRVLDPKIRQFVQTLHDHNQWPMAYKQQIEFECTATTRNSLYAQDYRLTISSNQAWTLSRFTGEVDWSYVETVYPVLEQTAKGTQVKSSTELVSSSGLGPRVIEPEFSLDELRGSASREMSARLQGGHGLC